jgi:hypothetical protein
MPSDRISPMGVGIDAVLTRPPVGAGDESAPSRPDRRRGAPAGPARGPGHPHPPRPPDHRQRPPGAPANRPASVRSPLATDLPGGDQCPLTTSLGRSRSGLCSPASRPGSMSRGRSSRRLRSSRGPVRAATRAGLEAVYGRSRDGQNPGASLGSWILVFSLVMSPPGADSRPTPGRESAPYGEEEAAPTALSTFGRIPRSIGCGVPWHRSRIDRRAGRWWR